MADVMSAHRVTRLQLNRPPRKIRVILALAKILARPLLKESCLPAATVLAVHLHVAEASVGAHCVNAAATGLPFESQNIAGMAPRAQASAISLRQFANFCVLLEAFKAPYPGASSVRMLVTCPTPVEKC